MKKNIRVSLKLDMEAGIGNTYLMYIAKFHGVLAGKTAQVFVPNVMAFTQR